VKLRTLAPAKVNLVLRVGPLRADGFHEIRSLMVPLDLADVVEIEVGHRRGRVTCEVPGRPELCGPGNLAARAAVAFRVRFGIDRAIRVRIEKRTPVTAGLGGGSSDAAATLRCLARAFAVDDRRGLHELAAGIGSDVPFFLGRGAAWAAGRGEALTPAEVPPLHLVLVYPPDPELAIRAGDAYRWLDELRQRRGSAPPRLSDRPDRFSLPRAGNDLEEACLVQRPALAPLLGLLREAGARKAMMSGSGPTCFGVFADRGAARSAALSIGAEGRGVGCRVLAVRTVRGLARVTRWRSPRSASSRSTKRSSRPTSRSRSTTAS
jgi:4-diphosphocytidyl-2-C-methyl-D-erythritol kinase